jgi:hypothetical protein
MPLLKPLEDPAFPPLPRELIHPFQLLYIHGLGSQALNWSKGRR